MNFGETVVGIYLYTRVAIIGTTTGVETQKGSRSVFVQKPKFNAI